MHIRDVVAAGIVAVAISAPGRAQTFEFELGLGPTWSETLAPAATARIGLDIDDWFTPSVGALGVFGVRGRDIVPANEPIGNIDGYQAWAVIAQLRAHTRGPRLQLTGGVGVGPGEASFIQCACTEQYALRGRVSPFYQTDIGVRVLSLPYWVALTFTGMIWTGLTTSTGEKSTIDGQRRVAFFRGSDVAFMATLSVGRQAL